MPDAPCWQCSTPTQALFCPNCHALQQPPREYFRILGLEPHLAVNLGDLQRRFYDLSRQLHPDRFTQRSAVEQENSLEGTAILNDAYRTLRDPVQRAEYVLKENGFDVGEQRSKDVPPELLEEVFELNMALEEMRGGDASARPALEDADTRFVSMQQQVDQRLEQLFRKYDETRTRDVLAEIRGVLNRRRYIQNLIREVQSALQ